MYINVLLDPLECTFGSYCNGNTGTVDRFGVSDTNRVLKAFFFVHISKTCQLFFLFTMCQEITVGSGEGGKCFRPATGPLVRDLDEGIYLPT
jgi:hypothetical protein